MSEKKQEKKQYTDKEKAAHYKKRAQDKTLTESQRAYANSRLFQLTDGKQGTQSGKKNFTPEEKRVHYRAVSKGEKPTKTPSKLEPQRQRDYAKGQVDARDEAAAIWGKQNYPDKAERQAYGAMKYGGNYSKNA